MPLTSRNRRSIRSLGILTLVLFVVALTVSIGPAWLINPYIYDTAQISFMSIPLWIATVGLALWVNQMTLDRRRPLDLLTLTLGRAPLLAIPIVLALLLVLTIAGVRL
ncbi:hypothetical protein [Plasticicumulans sp.]|uniref:hypothetical protein n=1 Tax=Plasticicumulans sp. TaxID=2307179 RepID=UPI000FB92533|nr:hypothetical protein [Plasticicumulans sp.]MBS0600432.1 hypothetical protein [Pseudomonadota bacterium]RTL05083.1 MAG: hypothetical protein EKK65_01515 [Xanthomonadales bacterium]HMV39100.1 hypothetical protein [Plasticicumulans sp.]HMW30144.1 hypothetical protein [Plasticicumulans sp.]HMW41928.1 hypothetical protein [Plasticicumulans sp.]